MLEIVREQWPLLRDLYGHESTNLTGYDLINSFTCWSAFGENIKIYATDGDWQNHGSFLLMHSFEHKVDIYLNTLTDSLSDLQLALETLQLSVPHLLCGYGNRFKPLVENYWRQRGLSAKQLEHQGTLVYHLPRSQISSFDESSIPGIKFGPLHCKHAELVDAEWAYRSPDSIALIKSLIKHNISVGAFDGTAKLLGWCLRSPHGSLCNLFVLPPHRRLGLASQLVRYMAQKIAATGAEVLSTVVINNAKSNKLFEKLGFRHITDIYWAYVPSSN